MSRRTEQLASTIQLQLQMMLARGLSDPRVRGLITITGVRVTEDLTTAFVSVSVLPAEQQTLTMHGLRAAAAFLRRELGDKIAIPTRPTLPCPPPSPTTRPAAGPAARPRARAPGGEDHAAEEDAGGTPDGVEP